MGTINKEQSIELASKIKRQIEVLASYEQDIPQIEIDIIKENIRNLYTVVTDFQVFEKTITDNTQAEYIDDEINSLLDEASQQFEEEKEKQIIEQETVLEEQAIEEKDNPEIPDEKTIAKVHEEIEEERLKAKEESIKEKVKSVAKVEEKVEIEKPGPKASSEADLKVKIEPKETKKTLREKKVYVLDVQPDEIEEDEDFKTSKINIKPIKNLASGIGINDKFMFINDLFEGDAKSYNKYIKKLDLMDNLQEALYLLGDMKDENLWDTNDSVFHQFKIYIERRFL